MRPIVVLMAPAYALDLILENCFNIGSTCKPYIRFLNTIIIEFVKLESHFCLELGLAIAWYFHESLDLRIDIDLFDGSEDDLIREMRRAHWHESKVFPTRCKLVNLPLR